MLIFKLVSFKSTTESWYVCHTNKKRKPSSSWFSFLNYDRKYHRAWPKFSLFHSWAVKINVEQKRRCWHCRGMVGISGSKVHNWRTFLLFSRGFSFYNFFSSFFWIFLDIFPFESLHIVAFLLNLSFSFTIFHFAVTASLHCFFDFFLLVFFCEYWISLFFKFDFILLCFNYLYRIMHHFALTFLLSLSLLFLFFCRLSLYLFIYLFIYLIINLLIDWLLDLLTYLFIYLFIYSVELNFLSRFLIIHPSLHAFPLSFPSSQSSFFLFFFFTLPIVFLLFICEFFILFHRFSGEHSCSSKPCYQLAGPRYPYLRDSRTDI